MTLTTYRLSSRRMTISVDVDEQSTIRCCPPTVRQFMGQPLATLVKWMSSQGGLEVQQVLPIPPSEVGPC